MLAPLVVAAANRNDGKLLPGSLATLTTIAAQVGLDLFGSFLTLDAGFSSAENYTVVSAAQLIPVIKPNHRKTKNPQIIAHREEYFALFQPIYHQRLAIERSFAWEDKYRKLVTRYERLAATFMGFRLLAYALVNFRSVCRNSL